MQLDNAVVLVTGANRGLGLEFARQALAAGAKKVYAGARDPSTVPLAGVIPVRLDVTDPVQVAQAAVACSDVTVVVNNAGIAYFGPLLQSDSVASLRAMFETNVLSILQISQAFAPILAKNSGGAFVNMLSAVSWASPTGMGAYSASKSAAWNLTNGLRGELQAQGTQVLGVHVGFVDTDLAQSIDAPKLAPNAVVEYTYAALAQGLHEVLIDEVSQRIKLGLNTEPSFYLLSGVSKA